MPDKLSLGLLGAGGKLVIENGMLRFSHSYGKTFSVPVRDIETVTLDMAGMGKATVKVIGRGTALAEVTMPKSWAEKCQAWILERVSTR